MRSCIFALVLAAALIASVAAKIDLFFEYTELHPGSTYKLKWETDHDYLLNLLLVKGLPGGGWTSKNVIFSDMVQQMGHGGWNWSVPFNIEADDKYGFWLLGQNYPIDGWAYANLTHWFSIADPEWAPRPCPPQIVRGVGAVVLGSVLVMGVAVLGVRRRRPRRRESMAGVVEREVLIEAWTDEKVEPLEADVGLLKGEC